MAILLLVSLLLVSHNAGLSATPTATRPNTTVTVRVEAIGAPTLTATQAPATTLAATRPPATPRSTQTATMAPEEPVAHPFHSPGYGVQAFLWWRPEIAVRDLEVVNELGFGWVKQSFAWRDIEGIQKGSYDWWRPDFIVNAIEEAGLKLVVRLDRQPFWSQEPGSELKENRPPANYQDFGDFCGVLAERYRGRIAAYQVWNEPNLSREWGDEPPDPIQYTRLLRACYQAIKAADPEAIVISAGFAPTGTQLPLAMPDSDFLQAMYDAGAAAYFDVLGVNAPGYKAPPEAAPEEGETNPIFGGGRWFVFRRVEDMRAIMVANGDAGKQIAILEMGWTTDPVNPAYAWHAVTERQQAEYLVRAYQYAARHWQPWIGLMVTIYIADYDWKPDEHEQYWWSIVWPDGTPRPAFYALREMEK